jgi:hypothetical protein
LLHDAPDRQVTEADDLGLDQLAVEDLVRAAQVLSSCRHA